MSAVERRLVTHTLEDLERAYKERDAANVRIARLSRTIELALQGFKGERDLRSRFDALRGGGVSRGGEVYTNVVALFRSRRRREWDISEIAEALNKQGKPAHSKALHNAIAYLASTGRLQRVSRGRYLVKEYGFGVEAADGTDDGTRRTTEHDA